MSSDILSLSQSFSQFQEKNLGYKVTFYNIYMEYMNNSILKTTQYAVSDEHTKNSNAKKKNV